MTWRPFLLREWRVFSPEAIPSLKIFLLVRGSEGLWPERTRRRERAAMPRAVEGMRYCVGRRRGFWVGVIVATVVVVYFVAWVLWPLMHGTLPHRP